jgi:hypothetical protein
MAADPSQRLPKDPGGLFDPGLSTQPSPQRMPPWLCMGGSADAESMTTSQRSHGASATGGVHAWDRRSLAPFGCLLVSWPTR